MRAVDKQGWVASGTAPRYAWIPIDRAIEGAVVEMEFPPEEPGDFEIVECDTLVVPSKMRTYCEEIPPP